MSDLLVEIAKNPLQKKVYQTLGMPVKLPQPLERRTEPWSASELADKVIWIETPDTQFNEEVKSQITRAGGKVDLGNKADGLVFDASSISSLAELKTVYQFFHDNLPRLNACAKLVLLGRELAPEVGAEAVAAQQALVGFTKSLAKEIGSRGATAQLLILPNRSSEICRRLRAPLIFFLSPRCAFISGQVITINELIFDPENTPEGATAIPEVQILNGKSALVTGAAQGIGAEIATQLAREGARVLGVDHPSQHEKLEALMGKIGGTSLLLDLAKDESVSKIVSHLKTTGGKLDILINNAGITRDKTLAKMAPEAWDLVMRINTEVPLQLSESLLDADRLAPDGRVIFLSSVVGLAGNFGQTNYSASKAALVGLVAAMKHRFAEKKISVNAIAPGFIETPMTGKMPVMMRQFGRRLSSLRQGGLPEDVAQLATFLSSPGAYGITGATIRVCGQAIVG